MHGSDLGVTASKYPRQFYVDASERLRGTLRFGKLVDRAPDVEAAARKLKSAHVYAQTHGLPVETQRRIEDLHHQAEGLLALAQSGKDPAPADPDYVGNYHPRLKTLINGLEAEVIRADDHLEIPQDPAAPPSAEASCGYQAFMLDLPPTSWTGMRYGRREKMLGLIAIGTGAGIGAIIPGEHKGRNAAIGALAGLLLGGWKAYSDYKAWKALGGLTGHAGACEGHESTVDKTVQKMSALGRTFGDVAFAANNVAGTVERARGFFGG